MQTWGRLRRNWRNSTSSSLGKHCAILTVFKLDGLITGTISYWQEVNTLEDELKRYRDEREGVNLNQEYVTTQLEKLKKTNVYNDTFRIWHDGPFGTINGMLICL